MLIKLQGHIKQNIIVIGLVVVVILSAFLRFKALTFQSYWLDELFSVVFSSPDNSFSTMYDRTVTDVHPPLYQAILWVWYHLFGFTEFSGRFLSALIGTMGVVSIYLLGKEFYTKEVGFYAAIIASMNPFLIFYSQEVRSYGLLFFFSSISYIYLLRVLKSTSHKDFILYLLFTVALLYTHYFGLFLVATQVFVVIVYFIREAERRKNLIILGGITALVLVSSLLPLVQHILDHEAKESFWIRAPSNWFVLEYMQFYVKSRYLESVFLLMILFSLFSLIKKEAKQNRVMVVILFLWVFIGYLLPYIRSVTAIPLLTQRNTIIIVPALIILISYGIFLLNNLKLKVVTLSVIIFFSINQFDNTSYYSRVAKEQWREVLFEVNKSKTDFQVYDFLGLRFEDFYKTYANMLNINLNFMSRNELKKDFKEKTLPSCFWAIDAHNDNMSKFDGLKDKSIKQVFEIKKFSARAILYSYNTSTEKCLSDFNGK